MSKKAKSTGRHAGPTQHPDDALLLKYQQGDASSEELLQVRGHLHTCSTCFALVEALNRQSLTPDYDAALERTAAEIEIDEEKVFAAVFPAKARPSVQPKPRQESLWTRILQWQPVRAAGLAGVALVVVFLGWPEYQKWQSRSLTDGALATMQENYRIDDRNTPRPAGAFGFSPFTQTRGDEAAGVPEEIDTKLREALQRDPENARAAQFLGSYFLLVKENTDSAEVYYRLALSHDPNAASIRNDLGVLEWRRGNITDALASFDAALELDADHGESQFNRALALQKLGRTEEAVAAWNAYLAENAQSEWAPVARAHLQNLRGIE